MVDTKQAAVEQSTIDSKKDTRNLKCHLVILQNKTKNCDETYDEVEFVPNIGQVTFHLLYNPGMRLQDNFS